MYSITNRARDTMLRVLTDIKDANDRAGCSDAYFRQHFMTLVRLPMVNETVTELEQAIETDDDVE